MILCILCIHIFCLPLLNVIFPLILVVLSLTEMNSFEKVFFLYFIPVGTAWYLVHVYFLIKHTAPTINYTVVVLRCHIFSISISMLT